MAPDSIVDETRTRSDDAVRRLREESRRRIERQNGWRAFSSLCAVASLAGGISLAALNAREARLQQAVEEAAAADAAKADRARVEAAHVRTEEIPAGPTCLGMTGLRELEREVERDRIRADAAREAKRAGKARGKLLQGKLIICGGVASAPLTLDDPLDGF